jgi:hypothetical protein
MGEKPSPSHSIDRINNEGHYEPGNCRWALQDVQGNNRSTNIMVTAFGETKNVKAWSKDSRCAVKYWVLWNRINQGNPPELSITHPSDPSSFMRAVKQYRNT